VSLDPHERLIVALDVPSVAEAEKVVVQLGESVSFYKIGYQLAFAGGIDFARVLASAGKRIFLDLKLHDIGNTVAKGVESVAALGASFLTVHAYPQTMHAAVDARKGSGLRLLAVTVLTSYDDADLAAAGYDFTVSELVGERAAQARDVGIDGQRSRPAPIISWSAGRSSPRQIRNPPPKRSLPKSRRRRDHRENARWPRDIGFRISM